MGFKTEIKQYGNWMVLDVQGSTCIAKCKCGKIKTVKGHTIRNGTSKDCGCSRNLNSKKRSDKRALPDSGQAFNALYSKYQKGAESRDLSFSLSKSIFRELTSSNCRYCDRKPYRIVKSRNGRGDYIYNGIDRLNNSQGYTLENSVPCCADCNWAKNEKTETEFVDLCRQVIKTHDKIKFLSDKKLHSFHLRALAIASQSPDPTTKVAALLIHGESGAVIADGFNGFIRGADDSNIPTTRPEKYDYIIHAETNLLCNAVHHGISTNNCVIYCTISPCIKCMRMLYQAGIKEVYVKGFYSDFEKCSSMLDMSLTVTTQGEFSRIEIKPKRNP